MRLFRTLKQTLTFQTYKNGYQLAPRLLRPRPSSPQVLLYHNVEDTECPLINRLGITVTPRNFEAHIRYLTANYHVVPFAEICLERQNPRAIAITFDDGLRSVRTVVLPIIEKYHCPIKVYITTNNLRGLNWLNQLSYLMNVLSPRELARFARTALALPPDFTPKGAIYDFINFFDVNRTPQTIGELFARVYRGPVRPLYLTVDEIHDLASHPLVEIGSHTRNHYPLPRLDRQQLHEEVVENHTYLNRVFDHKVRGFCLPFGYRNHLTAEVIEAVRKVDSFVVSAYGGRLDDSKPYGLAEVKRIGVWGNLGTLWHRLTYPL